MYGIKIENKYGDQLQLTQNDAYVTKATGLSPVSSNIITASVANYGGERYVSSRQQKRNIVLTIYVNEPVETNRINLYKYIKSDDYIKLYYTNKTRNVYIEGYVESFDLDHFAQTQTAQVSIICPQPSFIDMNSNEMANAEITKGFHCPFNSEVRVSDEGVFNNLSNGLIKFTDFLVTPETTQDGTPAPDNVVMWGGLGELNGTHYQSKLCLGSSKRNLYTGTKDLSGDDWTTMGYAWWINGEIYKGFTVAERIGAWFGLGQYLTAVAGEVYTFSGYYKCTEGASIAFYANRNSATVTNNGRTIGNAQEWTYFSITFEVITGGTIEARLENSVEDTNTCICGLKLERGDRATDWTPAPEDNMNVGKVFTAVTIPLGDQSDGVNLIRGGQSLVDSHNILITNVLTDSEDNILLDDNGNILYE